MAWTDEQIEELQRLWKQGLTTGDIGKKLGVSKNAVVGKAHRLGLESRPSPIKREELKQAKKKATAPKKKKNKFLTLNDLPAGACRWPIGDPKEPDFHFCGKETFMGKPYCAEHCLEAYVGVHKSKDGK